MALALWGLQWPEQTSPPRPIHTSSPSWDRVVHPLPGAMVPCGTRSLTLHHSTCKVTTVVLGDRRPDPTVPVAPIPDVNAGFTPKSAILKAEQSCSPLPTNIELDATGWSKRRKERPA